MLRSIVRNAALIVFALTPTALSGGAAWATDCQTNCPGQCTNRVRYNCVGTITDPWRECEETYVDPACKLRCDIEREAACWLNANSCQFWDTNLQYQSALNYLRRARELHLLRDRDHCEEVLNDADKAAALGGAAKTAYELVQGTASFNPVGLAAVAATKAAGSCACRSVFPQTQSESTSGGASYDVSTIVGVHYWQTYPGRMSIKGDISKSGDYWVETSIEVRGRERDIRKFYFTNVKAERSNSLQLRDASRAMELLIDLGERRIYFRHPTQAPSWTYLYQVDRIGSLRE